ncbi:NAD-binding protein [Irpex rosettiformis]|uniref:NAD-binding protein n=1 Tax=Irpex rosettiformis TaxID=378272 RepID=A0ACB8U2B3_9APHY|nr:NAD-binding protein [Irpex rosettiformis]
MPAIQAPATVLVTGANGFIAMWITKYLLDKGYFVRGTVRNKEKAAYPTSLFKKAVEAGRLDYYVVPDFLTPGAFNEAVKGVDAIIHTATPVTLKADDPEDLIRPSLKGTVAILESALKEGGSLLKRIIYTASNASIFDSFDSNRPSVVNESNWNETSVVEVREKGREARQLSKYRASKALAERELWNWYEQHKSEISWDITAVHPPLVVGPVLQECHSLKDINESNLVFYDYILSGKKTPEEVAAWQLAMVDVRDVADGHIRALEVPEAGGERIILSAWMAVAQDFFDTINELNVTGFDVPIGIPGSGKDFKYRTIVDNTKARKVLGIQFRDKKEVTKDLLESICRLGGNMV